MKKLLYIAPHLSTGGLPQYLTKKIELIRDSFDIYVVEWSNHTGGVLVVQRDKITSMIAPDKFFTLEENKMQLIDIINQVSPDIYIWKKSQNISWILRLQKKSTKKIVIMLS